MGVELLRIDDRLVHGQVVEGWVKALHITRLVVASDVVDADDTQKALYHLAVPHGVELTCLNLSEAAKAWKARQWDTDRVQVLKGISLDDQDVRALQSLASQGVMLEARALPLDDPFDMAQYLERWQEERDALREQPR